ALFAQFEGLVGSMRGFVEEADGVGLEEIVAGAVTVASTLLLGRALPNGVLLGKKAAAALDRPGMAHDSARSSNPS
ncbi:MAG: hypothetical protein GY944_12355, partial [bacterium]|nr:hypothetical protein [bacterium]